MSAIEVKETTYDNWGRCLSLSNGIVDIVVTLDFGPRIIRYGLSGQKNMLWEDIDQNFNVELEHDSYSDKLFISRGGHRFWISPEAMPRTYYPDNTPVMWEKIENGAILQSKTEQWTQIQKELEITVEEASSKITITHRAKNKGAWPIEFSTWAITCMAKGGREIIPLPDRSTGLLPNKKLILWSYTKMNDSRVYWGDRYIVLDHDPDKHEPFKLGINNEAGWAAYCNHNIVFVKQYFHDINAEYPDYGVSYETYTDNRFLELETLGELKLVEPDETAEHIECWRLFEGIKMPDKDEQVIDDIICKLAHEVRL